VRGPRGSAGYAPAELMSRGIAFSLLAVVTSLLLGATVLAATGVTSRTQLRGHLPDIGETASMRVFQTAAAYDSYRTSLGDANVFPASGSLSMSFDREILALYARGNDTGGRCLQGGPSATLDGNTVTLDLSWQSGTCGAPASAHYPFILVSLSRTGADGTNWVQPATSVCASAPDVSARACAQLSGASPLPTASLTSSPAATPTTSPAATATPTGTAARTLTPAVTGSPAANASPTPTRSPAAAATIAPGAADSGPNLFLVGALVVVVGLIGIALIASRQPRGR
jgi:hypothetical protein